VDHVELAPGGVRRRAGESREGIGVPLLRRGQVLTSGDGSRWYAVGFPLGEGGFAQAFSGWQLDRSGRRRRRVCIKVTPDATSWHGESYFGQLLLNDPRVVGLLDSFPHLSRAGTEVRYILVFELERETVLAWFGRGGTSWTESGARRELMGLLGVLRKLHGMGATHRDITPDNVYVANRRRLKLGDFGIAKHGLGGAPIHATAFAMEFVSPSLRSWQRNRWYPSDDLYQLGLLAVTLLRGEVTSRVTAREIKRLSLHPDLEHVLIRATGPRRNRFDDATEMLTAIREPWAEIPVPRSLAGRRVAFTGGLPVPRHEAQARLAQVGGAFQNDVNGRTQVLVVGTPSPNLRSRRGRKISDASRRIENGQAIAIIGWDDFIRLTRRTRRQY
jgi:serine/threonine protein kinase